MSNILITLGTLLLLGVGMIVVAGAGIIYIGAIREMIWGNQDATAIAIVLVVTALIGYFLIGLGGGLH